MKFIKNDYASAKTVAEPTDTCNAKPDTKNDIKPDTKSEMKIDPKTSTSKTSLTKTSIFNLVSQLATQALILFTCIWLALCTSLGVI